MYTRIFFLKDVAGCHTKYFKGESRGKGRQKSMPLKALVPPRPWGSFFLPGTEGRKESQKTVSRSYTISSKKEGLIELSGFFSFISILSLVIFLFDV